jgi:hypothetical protein
MSERTRSSRWAVYRLTLSKPVRCRADFIAGLSVWLPELRRRYAAPTEAELAALRRSVARGLPYGSAAWTQRTARRLGVE